MPLLKTPANHRIPKHILPLIILSQFCCTSLWFAGNAVMDQLISNFQLTSSGLSILTSAVQFGFISGTLIFALYTISDRFNPSKVFMICALLAAISNGLILLKYHTLCSLFICRFLTGFFLAGIYPVGMKIAADYFNQALGKALGFLVGALVLGTAFPHLLQTFTSDFQWKHVIITTSLLACIGGVFMYLFVPNGPYRQASHNIDLSVIFQLFKNKPFKAAAFGYFGHMWELYAFWAFIPVILKTYNTLHAEARLNIALLSFIVIASGSIGCILSGMASKLKGTKQSAIIILGTSCCCCLLSPLFFYSTKNTFIIFLLIWGIVVVADSPLFSTLVAQNTTATVKGSALTIVNCIGFSITIISIQTLGFLQNIIHPALLFLILALGPFLGLNALRKSYHSKF